MKQPVINEETKKKFLPCAPQSEKTVCIHAAGCFRDTPILQIQYLLKLGGVVYV